MLQGSRCARACVFMYGQSGDRKGNPLRRAGINIFYSLAEKIYFIEFDANSLSWEDFPMWGWSQQTPVEECPRLEVFNMPNVTSMRRLYIVCLLLHCVLCIYQLCMGASRPLTDTFWRVFCKRPKYFCLQTKVFIIQAYAGICNILPEKYYSK